MAEKRGLNWPAKWMCLHCWEARRDLYLRDQGPHEEVIAFCDACDPEPGRPRVSIVDAAWEAWPHATEDDVGSRIEFALGCGPCLGVWDGSEWRDLDGIMSELLEAASRLLRWYASWGA